VTDWQQETRGLFFLSNRSSRKEDWGLILGKRANPILLFIAAFTIIASLAYFASHRVSSSTPNNTPMHVRH
jgi:hypothetical protein